MALFLVCFLIQAVGSPARKSQKVQLKTENGWSLSADFTPPKKDASTFILLHGLGAGKGEWQNFRSAAHEKGYGTFALDLRGHGESTQGPQGKREYPSFSEVDWNNVAQDVDAALGFLKKKGIPERKVVLMGASIGANIAIHAAVIHPKIEKVILLSPGRDYQGVVTEGVLAQYGSRPLLVAASVADSYAFSSAKTLFDQAQHFHIPVAFVQASQGHGVRLFEGDEGTEILKQVLHWCQRH
ncbi:MAG: alpha/beta fold hydrolase [Elusimicrobia bacterium]|nr:alpha/beta fold hydrolase [Elusimicrobiota bacterium]